ncbi:hypothetical protein MKX08_002839 [Trichoderma sp. CBMAI-0020]|nr:hypothetical protein MKX08_002839 [Trichoderma sp. CBMAI-0020]
MFATPYRLPDPCNKTIGMEILKLIAWRIYKIRAYIQDSYAAAAISLGSLVDRAALVYGTGRLTWCVGVEVVKGLINNFPAKIEVAIEARVAVQLLGNSEAEIQSRSTVRVPNGVVAGAAGASGTAITDKQVEVMLDAIGGDNDFLATILGQIAGQ